MFYERRAEKSLPPPRFESACGYSAMEEDDESSVFTGFSLLFIARSGVLTDPLNFPYQVILKDGEGVSSHEQSLSLV